MVKKGVGDKFPLVLKYSKTLYPKKMMGVSGLHQFQIVIGKKIAFNIDDTILFTVQAIWIYALNEAFMDLPCSSHQLNASVMPVGVAHAPALPLVP